MDRGRPPLDPEKEDGREPAGKEAAPFCTVPGSSYQDRCQSSEGRREHHRSPGDRPLPHGHKARAFLLLSLRQEATGHKDAGSTSRPWRNGPHGSEIYLP